MEMKKNFSILVNKDTIRSIAIGGFDGMHLAHQKLFESLDDNGAIIVIETGYANLTPNRYRQEYTKFPVYQYVLENIRHLDGEEFVKLLKEEFPKLNKIVVGFDFHFGKNRKYSSKELSQMFEGEVIVVNEIKFDDLEIHSRNIREHLKNSDLKTANKLLNRNYKIYGRQIKGQGLGSKNFVPTINLLVEEFLLPSSGVYITKTILNEITYNSITFLGHRQTTDDSFAIETHILQKDIINDDYTIEIEFIKKLRDNKKFDTFEALKKQIDIDINDTLDFFIID
jgi:riboflavin kinase/FMN adenylyltransferase